MRYLLFISLFIFTIVVYLNNNIYADKKHLSSNKLGPITISIKSIPEPKTRTEIETSVHDQIFNEIGLDRLTKKTEQANLQKPKSLAVPFYSQFSDISDPNWKKVGCGIASLAMIIELYRPGEVSVDNLLKAGIKSGAYLNDAGWIHGGLIGLANNYGLDGASHDLSKLTTKKALEKLEDTLDKGPVMASVHYTFDPQNPIPHLVVINKISGDKVFYNDPSEKFGNNSISTDKFLKAWKKRYIEIRPT